MRSPYHDDFLQLRLYKIKSQEIKLKRKQIEKIKQMLIPVLLLLLTIAIYQTHSSKELNKSGLSQLYQTILNEKSSTLSLDSLDDFRSHFYNILKFSNSPSNRTLMKVERDNLNLKFSWQDKANLDLLKLEVDLTSEKSFDIENVQEVLNLPFPVGDLKKFGNYFSNVINMKLKLSGLKFCLKKARSSTVTCFVSEITIRYMNHNNVVTSTLKSSLTSQVSPPYFNIKFLLNWALMLLCCLLLSLDIILYFFLVKRKKLEKHFQMAKLIYQENYNIEFGNITKNQFELGISFIMGFIGNLSLFYFFLSKLLGQNQSEGLFRVSIVLGWISVFETFTMSNNLQTMINIFRHAFHSLSKIILVWVALSVAFIFSGWLLFPTSNFFNSLANSFTTLFALLVGDSLLPLYKDLSVYTYLAVLYISKFHKFPALFSSSSFSNPSISP